MENLQCIHMMGFFSYPTSFVLRILISFPYAILFLAALRICPNSQYMFIFSLCQGIICIILVKIRQFVLTPPPPKRIENLDMVTVK